MSASKFNSRKLFFAVGVALLAVLNERFALGMTADTIGKLVDLAGYYLLGQAAVDLADKISPATVSALVSIIRSRLQATGQGK